MEAEAQVRRGELAATFLGDLARIRAQVVVTLGDATKTNPLELETGLATALTLFEDAGKRNNKLIFVGNGGSAAIASHQAVDYWKNGGIPAIAFNDASLLTCISNDFGYERVFAEPIARFGARGDVLVAVSSSGKSPNILRAVEAARAVGCEVVTFSGFDPANPLRKTGTLNFYVPSHSYGIVEILHLSLIHAILEERMLEGKKSATR
jgi:D-sedoheptulose 7-phosphate isomerase